MFVGNHEHLRSLKVQHTRWVGRDESFARASSFGFTAELFVDDVLTVVGFLARWKTCVRRVARLWVLDLVWDLSVLARGGGGWYTDLENKRARGVNGKLVLDVSDLVRGRVSQEIDEVGLAA